MTTLTKNKGLYFVMLMTALILTLPYPGMLKGAEIPAAWDVATRKADIPTIEDLTERKVKKGDIIDKNNVGLVTQWLTPGTLEAVKQGLVLIMGTNSKPDEGIPEKYLCGI